MNSHRLKIDSWPVSGGTECVLSVGCSIADPVLAVARPLAGAGRLCGRRER